MSDSNDANSVPEEVVGGCFAADTLAGEWRPDILGEDFEYSSLHFQDDDEGPVSATIVRYRPDAPQETDSTRVQAVLYIHGWSDYFYHRRLAEYWHARGYHFFALDLRRFGRSLREWSTPGFITDLSEYDEDLSAAISAIRESLADQGSVEIVGMAHSTGGLVLSLFASRHPEIFKALILNSPWLEFYGSSPLRNTVASVLTPLARRNPRQLVKLPEVDHYWRSLSKEAEGEWDLHPLWRPRLAFPIRAGWLLAILNGHTLVSKGLNIEVPILALYAERSKLGLSFVPEMMSADSVLDVDVNLKRVLSLGRRVTVVRISDGMHDIFSSTALVRESAYEEITRWADGYLR
ncbi:alpha/beta hydrolase [Neomicrococcus lactis]